VIAPEHPLVDRITTKEQKSAVEAYREKASRKSELDRTELNKEKTGVPTGAYAVNPVTGGKIPVWIADYVLITYGTGAIMAVPAHDERDHEFAKKFSLPILEVIRGVEDSSVQEKAFTGAGTCIHCTTPDKGFSIDGLPSDQAKEKITKWLEAKGLGKASIQYKLRDWLFSRQRYWGEPVPVIHVNGNPKLIPESDLPLCLPAMTSFKPTGDGEPPLAAATDWVQTRDPQSGTAAMRETNTMPQWAGSCWYYLRYLDPHNTKALIDPEKEKYWMPVDLYIGGAEHAVLHLLYARFWHKVLFDAGVVSTKEPFQKLVNQGMILGEDSQKMSKSRGNVVSPDDLMEQYGADSIRLYEMFMGPLEMTKPWSMSGVEGVHRFLARAWRLFVDKEGHLSSAIQDRPPLPAELKRLHQTIKKVTEDLENGRYNTAISALMIFLNETLKDEQNTRGILENFLLLLAPFAPHLAEELWQRLGHDKILAHEPWPSWDEKHLIEDQVEMAVLVSGKVRTKIVVSKSTSEDEIRRHALEHAQIRPWVEGKTPRQVVVVPGRIVNIVL